MSERGDIDFQRKLLTFVYEQCGIFLADEEKSELYFMFLVNGSLGLLQNWLKSGLTKTPEEIAKQIAEIIYTMAS
jgi:hypothetical protein